MAKGIPERSSGNNQGDSMNEDGEGIHQSDQPWWTGLLASVLRVTFATLIAVPTTALLTACLYLVPPPVALGVCICGMVASKIGAEFNRHGLLVIGGVSMFAGVLSWAFRQ